MLRCAAAYDSMLMSFVECSCFALMISYKVVCTVVIALDKMLTFEGNQAGNHS